MRLPLRAASALLLPLLLTACTSHHDTGHFMTSVNSLRPGTPMSSVREQLGKPDETHAGTMPVIPPPGPLEAVVGRIPPGVRYQEWVYHHDDSRFHILFAQTIVQSGETWEVVNVRSVPKTQPG